ncbi:MAG: ADP-glyceromanno-heptose 6-epimerase [Saprospiraceae bacterium]|nr:ADP-glyceromanno-heptose 6-epimerase [Saprospiraceae bacterium]MCB9325571.1 ADP-glyceromanno-heptose 6-epimerase [Lewinellaceae bacterium]
MIVITGAAGFIGSCIVRKLNDEGYTNLMIVDDFSRADKNVNFETKVFTRKMDRKEFPGWLEENQKEVGFVYHMGARTDTTEKDKAIFDELNLNYTKALWNTCTKHNIPFVYASSAATYGLGEHGYEDSHDIVGQLKPLNPYGDSKNDFDIWALKQKTTPPLWVGLKFFNVYGPNEYHKGRMASVIFHTLNQINATGSMKLFRSHRPDFENGHQSRDFVYIKDVVDVCYFFYLNRPQNGLFNLGTGKARTFLDLAKNTFFAMGLDPDISFVDTPEDIRETYQYFTEANMEKLRKAGYDKPFYSLEEGIKDYVQQYLLEEKIW